MAGEVIVINAQIFTLSDGFQGVSFAIPMDVANRVAQHIVSTDKVRHAKLGMAVQEVDQLLAESLQMPRPAGALVSESALAVRPNAPGCSRAICCLRLTPMR